jgi:plastocyanin domain-containing protein
MKTKYGQYVVAVMGIAVIGAFLSWYRPVAPPQGQSDAVSVNVSVANGVQVIAITAHGGYTSRVTKARANMPTLVRVTTNNTYDCSAALVFPALGIRNMLPPTGVTDISIPVQAAGATVWGVCTMGMYNFQIQFR